VLERGILCRQDAPRGFARGLEYVIQNIHIWEEISNSARSFVARIHSKERLLQDMESVYLELLKYEPVRISAGADAAWRAGPCNVAALGCEPDTPDPVVGKMSRSHWRS
jgi:hypothetical protein